MRRKRLVSYANNIGSNVFDVLHRSFTEIRNSNGPRIDPWGMPHLICARLVTSLL